MIDRFANLIDTVKSLDARSLEAFRIMAFMLIVADLFGVYWYLKMKTLGGALLLILIGLLALIILLERRLEDDKGGKKKMSEEDKTKKEKIDKLKKELKELEGSEEKTNEEVESNPFGMDMGLPDPDEYNKRVENAMGI